jgi:DNA gyrase subunit A
MPNFDETENEPTVLPARYPNLLVNGSSGIAVGMATNIPPHNLNEVINGVIALIDKPDIEINELIQYIKGPDFPTGAVILGKEGIYSAYKTGRGRVKVRSKVDIEPITKTRNRIVVSEIPYMVNKSKMVEKIADLVKQKKIDGISDIRDESDRNGIRIAIDLKRDVNEEIILNQLYKHTQLQDNFGIIMLALVNNEPKVLNLKEMLYHYVEHQKEIITRRTEFDLKKAEARAHILEGLIIALDNIDEIIRIIRASYNDAEIQLMKNFPLSEIQAKAIVDMRLRRLQGLEREKLETEYSELMALIEKLKAILADEQLVLNIIKEELTEIKEKYGDDRRTDFDLDVDEIEIEDLIEEEDVVITMTHVGYVKRISADTYSSQRRGGKGIKALETRENDFVEHLYTTTTHHYLLFFTNKGKMYRLKAYEIPDAGRTAKGMAIVNILSLDSDEKVTTMIPIKEFAEDNYLIMATRHGMIKKTDLQKYATARKNGLIAINLRDDDELIGVAWTDGNKDILLGTKKGFGIRFNEKDVRSVGRTAIGVRGISLRPEDYVIGMDLFKENSSVFVVSEKGYGKLTPEDQYRAQNRGGKGATTYKITKKTGNLAGICIVDETEAIMLINSQGIVIKIDISGISTTRGKSTQGVRLMKLPEDVLIATIAKTYQEKEIEEDEELAEEQE